MSVVGMCGGVHELVDDKRDNENRHRFFCVRGTATRTCACALLFLDRIMRRTASLMRTHGRTQARTGHTHKYTLDNGCKRAASTTLGVPCLGAGSMEHVAMLAGGNGKEYGMSANIISLRMREREHGENHGPLNHVAAAVR